MNGNDAPEIGTLIQRYLRAKWASKPDSQQVAQLGAQLTPTLRDRIDVLGMDGERLLEIAPGAALARLSELEREAAIEDARAQAAAARLRAAQERGHHPARNSKWPHSKQRGKFDRYKRDR